MSLSISSLIDLIVKTKHNSVYQREIEFRLLTYKDPRRGTPEGVSQTSGRQPTSAAYIIINKFISEKYLYMEILQKYILLQEYD